MKISITLLRTSGLTDTQIVDMLVTQETRDSVTQRDQNRIRQQNHRSRNAVTRDALQSPLSSLRKKESKKEEERGRGIRIPPDWKPSEGHYERGSKLGYQREQVDGFAETMRLWAEANAHRPVARKLNWDQAFDCWLRRQPKTPPPPSMNPAKFKPSPPTPPTRLFNNLAEYQAWKQENANGAH
jgi:hypothetical protein